MCVLGPSSLFPMEDERSCFGDDERSEQSLGVLGPSHCFPHQNGERIERYSRKVFVGGLPPDIDEGNRKVQPEILTVAHCTSASAHRLLATFTPGANLMWMVYSPLLLFSFFLHMHVPTPPRFQKLWRGTTVYRWVLVLCFSCTAVTLIVSVNYATVNRMLHERSKMDKGFLSLH